MRAHPDRRLRPAVLTTLAIGLLAGAFAPNAAEAGPTAPPSVIVPLAPERILDTRTAIGIASTTPLAADQTITLQVAGVAGVPADATGVVLNITVNGASGAGYVTAHPSGTVRPNASVINYSSGEDVANMITAGLGAGGAIDLYNAQASAHLIADVAGYLVAGGGGTGGPVGPAGPQGLQGPQGPAGPAAPTGLGFRQTMAVPESGTSSLLVGTIDTVAIRVSCASTDTAGLRFESTAIGQARLDGTQYNQTGATTSFIHAVFSPGIGSTQTTTGQAKMSLTLLTATGAFAQVEALLTVSSGICTFTGTVVPI